MVVFENLTHDPSADWAGAAVAGIIASELSGSTHTLTRFWNTAREARATQADRLLQGYVENAPGEWRFSAVLMEGRNGREIGRYVTQGTAAQLIDVADRLARETTKERLRPFPTRSPEAVKAWGQSIVAEDGAARIASLERAIQADANFGAAYVDLVQLRQAAGNSAGAAQAIEIAKQRANLFSDVDRARLELLDAESSGNREQRRRALVALSRLVPADARTQQALGDAEFGARHFPAAIALYRAALAISPGDSRLLNQIGYAEALAGNADRARDALEQYRRLEPAQANPIDSLGETQFLAGRFSDAEKYFLEAQSRYPAFLGGLEFAKAAQARLMQGNVPGADELFDRFIAQRRAGHDAAADITRLQWLYMTGRKQQALPGLEAIAAGGGSMGAYAAAQLAIWRLSAGDLPGAREKANRAVQLATGGGVQGVAIICQFLTQGQPDARHWQAAADQLFSNPAAASARDVTLAYALLLSRQFEAAADLLKKIYDQRDPANDAQIRTLYAWALTEQGKWDQAAPLLERYPLPISGGDLLFASLEFPRFLKLRAESLRRQKHDEEAARLLSLYQKLGGA